MPFLPTPQTPSSAKLQTRRAISIAIIYVLSGATQPLLITFIKSIGLGDTSCQLYMFFYYLGPALVIFSFCCDANHKYSSPRMNYDDTPNNSNDENISNTPHRRRLHHHTSTTNMKLILKASSIALIDITAQTLNYTGSTMAGPTIFAIIYSSVTIWTAIYSYIILNRKLSIMQWMGILIVFFGLFITSLHSVQIGNDVMIGTLLVVVGSSLHALTYVLSEIIMTKGIRRTRTTEMMRGGGGEGGHEQASSLSLRANCSIQAIVGCMLYFIWQMTYTKQNYHDKIEIPMEVNGTTIQFGIMVLCSLSVSNLIHATSFFYTLKNFPGGATSAGVMKGLQAVLVFIFSSLVYCHEDFGREIERDVEGRMRNYGGEEMCFTVNKLISLIVVSSGVVLFAIATDSMNDGNDNNINYNDIDINVGARPSMTNNYNANKNEKEEDGSTDADNSNRGLPMDARMKGYQPIPNGP